MKQCWAAEPESRPTIQTVFSKLEDIQKELKKPVQAVLPQLFARSHSEYPESNIIRVDMSGPISTSAGGKSGLPGVPSVAYDQQLTSGNPKREETDIPLMVRGYKFSDAERRPRMFEAYASAKTTEEPGRTMESGATDDVTPPLLKTEMDADYARNLRVQED